MGWVEIAIIAVVGYVVIHIVGAIVALILGWRLWK